MKITLEGVSSRLDEVENQISNLKDKTVAENNQLVQQEEKEFFKKG